MKGMVRGKPTQLSLPLNEREPIDILHTTATPGELTQLRARLPPEIRLGTWGWAFPGWGRLVWAGQRRPTDLARSGLREYGAHPLFSVVAVQAGDGEPRVERDLRRLAGQWPEHVRCFVETHPIITTPRFTRRQQGALMGGGAGQVNRLFLDSRFFREEIYRAYQAALGPRLGLFLFTFSPMLKRWGMEPEVFARRLEAFLADLPGAARCAVELREPDFLTPEYGAVLARYGATHVFTTAAAMPPLAEQARVAPADGEMVVQVVDPSGKGPARRERLLPFDQIRAADLSMREAVVDHVAATRPRGANLLVHNEAEGCAPLTVLALARMLVDRLGV